MPRKKLTAMCSARFTLLLLLCAGLALSEVWSEAFKDYWTERSEIMLLERRQSLGGGITLKGKERDANLTLMKYKQLEWNLGFERPGDYPPNMHFFHGKSAIENSTVFKIIKRMPKGVLLHTHDFGMLSYTALLKLTYTDNLYVCDEPMQGLRFKFLKTTSNSSCPTGWQLLAGLRNSSTANIDARIRDAFSLVVDNPRAAYPNIDVVWSKFHNIFITLQPLLSYKPVFEKYFYHALQELYDDNVWYVQVRTILPDLYDLEGRVYKDNEVVQSFKEAFEKFKLHHKKFIGAKIIYAPPRNVTNETMIDYVNTFVKIKTAYNDFVLGFDLVGQEDKGTPLKDFLPQLIPLKDKYDFFFHAGETDWYGSMTDENLVDAILLGTKRIGHGYALLKHPQLLQRVYDHGIVVEVSPISNQVLRLVYDIRNHPAAVFGAMSIPMVVTNDDPTFWDAKGVSYDWYMAYMGMASAHSDLRYLKQLALNSIIHSGLDKSELSQLLVQWMADWKLFVRWLAQDTID